MGTTSMPIILLALYLDGQQEVSSEHQHHSLVRISVRGQLHIHYEVTTLALVEINVTNRNLVQVQNVVHLLEALMIAAFHVYCIPRHLIGAQHRAAHAAPANRPQLPQGLAIHSCHYHFIFVADRGAALKNTLGSS